MEKVKGYETPIWAQACFGLAVVAGGAALFMVLVALMALESGTIGFPEVWMFAGAVVVLLLWAILVGGLGALLVEVRKHRISWCQKNEIDSDVEGEAKD